MNKTGKTTTVRTSNHLNGISAFPAKNPKPTDFPPPKEPVQEPSKEVKAWFLWFYNSQYSGVIKC